MSSSTIRRIGSRGALVTAVGALALGLGVTGIAVATPGHAATTSCATVTWGSLAKTGAGMTTKPITNVRTGKNTCYDRLVVDIGRSGSGTVGFDVRYVSAVYAEGSGLRVPVRGGAVLQIVAKAPAYDAAGHATYRPANTRELTNVTGYSAFRQVAWAGSFEGQSTIALGVRARLPMRAFVLSDADGSRRLVVDVEHTW